MSNYSDDDYLRLLAKYNDANKRLAKSAALPSPDSAGLIAEAQALVPQQSELVARVLTDLVAAVEAAEARAVELLNGMVGQSLHRDDERRRAEAAERQLAAAREALEIIAGRRQCLDNLMGNRDVAEAALAAIAGEK